MLLSLHQPARFFATAKTHKLEKINDITIDNLNFKYVILKHKWKSIIYINRYIILLNNKSKFCPNRHILLWDRDSDSGVFKTTHKKWICHN